MPKNSESLTSARRSGTQFYLQVVAGVLAALNAVALFLYLAPPGGSREQLAQESSRLRGDIAATRTRMQRLKGVSEKVQLGSTESSNFESQLFLSKRVAYGAVISEIQRMAKASGLSERDGVYQEEPIEGSSDLSVLNITARYEGSYDNLLKFLYEADKSPMLLMLDTMRAAPQQRGGRIDTEIRFQTIIREAGGGRGGQL